MTTKSKPLDRDDAELIVALIINLCSKSPNPNDALWLQLRPRVAAIRDGHHEVIDKSTHVAVEKMTEAQVRERFELNLNIIQIMTWSKRKVRQHADTCVTFAIALGLIASEQEKK